MMEREKERGEEGGGRRNEGREEYLGERSSRRKEERETEYNLLLVLQTYTQKTRLLCINLFTNKILLY